MWPTRFFSRVCLDAQKNLNWPRKVSSISTIKRRRIESFDDRFAAIARIEGALSIRSKIIFTLLVSCSGPRLGTEAASASARKSHPEGSVTGLGIHRSRLKRRYLGSVGDL
jgi:hypothetical protein